MAEFFEELLSLQNPPTYKFYNGDAWVEPKKEEYLDINSPVDGSLIGRTPVVSQEEIDEAIARVRDAQRSWSRVSLDKRAVKMKLASDWIREHKDYLSQLLLLEIGKVKESAYNEVSRAADLIDYFTDEVRVLRGEEISSDSFPGFDKNRIAIVERVPLGVVLAIAPFNYPLNLSVSKIVPALLMGNGCVFKPATHGSLTGLHLTQAFIKAGIPKGLIACITGEGFTIGDYLTSHDGVDLVAFTGSTEVGRWIVSKAGMKPLLLECSGNNSVIVLEDADKVLTAHEIVRGGFNIAGQDCMGIKIVYSYQQVMDDLIENVLNIMDDKIKMGDPRDPSTKIVGPVITENSAKEIERIISAAVESGAHVVRGGKRYGRYIEPTILRNVNPDMEIVASETFGPVISFVTMNAVDDAVETINKSMYALQASIFTVNEETGVKIGRRLNVGTIQINSSPQRRPDNFPFLGVKKSGLGVQGVRYALEAMSRPRPIVLNKFELKTELMR